MDKHQKSTTRDVLALLKRLKKEKSAASLSIFVKMAAFMKKPLSDGCF